MPNYSVKNAYEILNSRGQLITSIRERKRDKTTSLVLHGRGWSPYGLERNENIVYLLENFASSRPPARAIPGQFWWKSTASEQALYVFEPQGGSPAWQTAVPPSAGIGFSVTPGDGMDQTSGGLPTGSPLTTTPAIGAGRGFAFVDGGLAVQESGINHDSLLGFVANEHLDHSNISLQAGDGFADPANGSPNNPTTITYPGGTLEFNVGAGRGMNITSSTGLDLAVVWGSTTTTQTVSNTINFSGRLRANYLASNTGPSYGFDGDTNTGVYYQTARVRELSFTTGGVQRFRVESNGVLRAIPSNYETLISDPADFPNKAYVDTVAGTGANPTVNTHIGTSSISGLNGDCTYLVHLYGSLSNKGNTGATLSSIRLRRGSTTLGSGTSVAATGAVPINWFDGRGLSSVSFICDMNGDTSVNGAIEDTDCRGGASAGCVGSRRPASYMAAVT
jgi:hypothetical protein